MLKIEKKSLKLRKKITSRFISNESQNRRTIHLKIFDLTQSETKVGLQFCTISNTNLYIAAVLSTLSQWFLNVLSNQTITAELAAQILFQNRAKNQWLSTRVAGTLIRMVRNEQL